MRKSVLALIYLLSLPVALCLGAVDPFVGISIEPSVLNVTGRKTVDVRFVNNGDTSSFEIMTNCTKILETHEGCFVSGNITIPPKSVATRRFCFDPTDSGYCWVVMFSNVYTANYRHGVKMDVYYYPRRLFTFESRYLLIPLVIFLSYVVLRLRARVL